MPDRSQASSSRGPASRFNRGQPPLFPRRCREHVSRPRRQRVPRQVISPQRAPHLAISPQRAPHLAISPHRGRHPAISPRHVRRPGISLRHVRRRVINPPRVRHRDINPHRARRLAISLRRAPRLAISQKHARRRAISPRRAAQHRAPIAASRTRPNRARVTARRAANRSRGATMSARLRRHPPHRVAADAFVAAVASSLAPERLYECFAWQSALPLLETRATTQLGTSLLLLDWGLGAPRSEKVSFSRPSPSCEPDQSGPAGPN